MPLPGSWAGAGFPVSGAGLALVAAAALPAVPEVALATMDTTFGDPLDTVQSSAAPAS